MIFFGLTSIAFLAEMSDFDLLSCCPEICSRNLFTVCVGISELEAKKTTWQKFFGNWFVPSSDVVEKRRKNDRSNILLNSEAPPPQNCSDVIKTVLCGRGKPCM